MNDHHAPAVLRHYFASLEFIWAPKIFGTGRTTYFKYSAILKTGEQFARNEFYAQLSLLPAGTNKALL
jgi:hypothetical protein